MESNGQNAAGPAADDLIKGGVPELRKASPDRTLARVALDFAEALPQESLVCRVFVWHVGELALGCPRNEWVWGEANFHQGRDQLIAWIRLAGERGWVTSEKMNVWLMDLMALDDERMSGISGVAEKKLATYQVRRRGWAFGARSCCGDSRGK